jgi:hypothetical protein
LLSLGLYIYGNLSNKAFLSIEQNTIVKHQPKVTQELLGILVDPSLNFLLNCREVHWILDHLKVGWQVKFDWVDWLMEEVGLIAFP